MSGKTTIIILLISIGAVLLALLLHWLIGFLQQRLVRWLIPAEAQAAAQPSLKHLLIDWSGNGLRTTVWTLLALFIFYLLPQTRTRFDLLVERLWQLRDRLAEWLTGSGVNAALAIVVTIFLLRFARALIRTGFELFERRATSRGETSAKRRSQTLSTIFSGVAQSIIFFLGLMSVLQQLNVNITPILASAGVVGIAVGFGAQSLIKDLFAGFLILLEDQYNVGDTIKIGDTAGSVEQLTLRATRVRALDGSLTSIPNGAITTVSNLSKDWSRIVLDVEIDYNEDAERAMNVMLACARQMREDHPAEIIEDPALLGIERLTNSSIVIRLTAKTVANKQAELARALRQRVKTTFDQLGIKAPSREQLVLASTPAPTSAPPPSPHTQT